MKYVFILLTLNSLSVVAKNITLSDIYEKFNMRTIYSSYGPRLKYYCGSYPKNYFPKENMKFINGKQLQLVSGNDIWVFTLKGENTFNLSNKIANATYNSGDEYSVRYDKIHNDWRANKILIKKTDDCKKYVGK